MVFIRILNTVTNKKSASTVPDFEAGLKKLESIVAKMEGGELNLEQALKQFEEGVVLARHCQEALRSAQQRVEALTAQTQAPLADFPNSEE